MRSGNQSYINIDENSNIRVETTPWYWRFIALAASWMILGGYLLLPGLYAKDPQLKFSTAVLSVFVVALLTAGYSFTALLCFACRDVRFQADGVFLPALTSSALGLVSIAYNFLSSRAYAFDISAISGTVISATATLTYAALLLWTHRRIVKHTQHASSRSANLWSDQPYYQNFIQNMYPTATRPSTSSPPAPPPQPVSEDDPVNQQMALLLMRSDSRPSPDANRATFNIDLPEDTELRDRHARSQELLGSAPPGLGEQQAWQQWQGRGRTLDRPASVGAGTQSHSSHSRNMSREERRREIELGHA